MHVYINMRLYAYKYILGEMFSTVFAVNVAKEEVHCTFETTSIAKSHVRET